MVHCAHQTDTNKRTSQRICLSKINFKYFHKRSVGVCSTSQVFSKFYHVRPIYSCIGLECNCLYEIITIL